jgi:hypothetical protein
MVASSSRWSSKTINENLSTLRKYVMPNRKNPAARDSRLEFELSRADARIMLCSMIDTSMYQWEALLNPSSLPIDIDVEIGELNPIGWSHSVQQYSHTKSLETSIELYFSTGIQGRRGPITSQGDIGRTVHDFDVADKVHWLSSFCYGQMPGEAPHPLLLVWPHVMNIALVMKKFHAEYFRFARNLRAMAAKVTLTCMELRFSYKSSTMQHSNGGFEARDPLTTVARSANAGYNLNLGQRSKIK